jgi:hypothetical protein
MTIISSTGKCTIAVEDNYTFIFPLISSETPTAKSSSGGYYYFQDNCIRLSTRWATKRREYKNWNLFYEFCHLTYDNINKNDLLLSCLSNSASQGLDILSQSRTKIEKLSLFYNFINAPKLTVNLIDNLQYLNILEKVAKNIEKYFGSEYLLLLELLDEFEEYEPSKYRITIITSSSLQNARSALKNFKINWFYKNFDNLNTRLMFSLSER